MLQGSETNSSSLQAMQLLKKHFDISGFNEKNIYSIVFFVGDAKAKQFSHDPE